MPAGLLPLVVVVAAVAPASTAEPERVAAARVAHEAALVARAAEISVAWPPKELYLRAFKRERELEVWVGDGRAPLVLFETVPICGESGGLGPKVEQGDLQIPEGLFIVTKMNPASVAWLSLKMSYPNTADRARAARRATEEKRKVSPGGLIMVHGTCISTGCLAIDDAPIERIYLLALEPFARGRSIRVHVFPARLDPEPFAALLDETDDVHVVRLWSSLVPAYQRFERERRVPVTWPRADGTYGVARR